MSQLFKNNAKSRLASSIAADGLSFTVTTGEGDLFPVMTADDHLLVTFENSSGGKEIVRVSARSGDDFTIAGDPIAAELPIAGRGREGTVARGFSAEDLVELRLTAGFIDALKEGSIVFVVDGGGSAITTGLKGWIEAPFSGTIKSAKLFADEISGSVSVDIYKSTYDNYPFSAPADVAELISTGLDISSGYKARFNDLTATGANWVQRNFLKGDIFIFDIAACSGFTKLTVSLTVDRY
jgi:hypothetical protein